MRITADIIDEEPCAECDSERIAKPERHLRIVFREPPKNEPSEKLVDSMLKQFQKLSIRFVPSASKYETEASAYEDKELNKGMESARDSDAAQKEQACCVAYAERMKEEIKKEVIDEVLKILKQKQTFEEFKANSEASASTSAVARKILHPGIFCDHCDQQIYGVRYKCGNCEDFDLCEECEKIPDIHSYRHVFLKLRYPFSLNMNSSEQDTSEACMVRTENGSYVFRPKSVPAKTHKQPDVKQKPEMMLELNVELLGEDSVPSRDVFPPGMKFVKSWRVLNTGSKQWDKDTIVKQLCGCPELKPYITEVSAPPLKSGEEGVVSVYFTAPGSQGDYDSYWEFCHQGKPFGPALCCRVRVELMQSSSILPSTPFCNWQTKDTLAKGLHADQIQCLLKNRRKVKEERRKRKECRKKEVKQIVDVLTAVHEEHACRRSSSGTQKTITSHTATPNNTPFDLSPPKSPEPREFIEIKTDATVSLFDRDMPEEEKSEHQISSSHEGEDKLSITTVSSSESDSEFVVIPMPKCFSVLDSAGASQVAAAQVSESAAPNVSGTQNALSETESKHSLPKSGSSMEQVSQETGAPEEAENFNVNTIVHVKEDCGKKIITSGISLNCSPSSSSVSVIESEESSSPTDSVHPSAPVLEEINQGHIRLTSSQEQDYSVGEQEQNPESPSRCTFPKFPLDIEPTTTPVAAASTASAPSPPLSGVASPSQPVPDSERTIQVLPEGLVTGALIAAASVYNTAKAVISSIQPGRNEQDENVDNASGTDLPTPSQQLIEMGFCNRALNERLLREKKNDVAAVVAELVSMNDNEWYAARSPDQMSGN